MNPNNYLANLARRGAGMAAAQVLPLLPPLYAQDAVSLPLLPAPKWSRRDTGWQQLPHSDEISALPANPKNHMHPSSEPFYEIDVRQKAESVLSDDSAKTGEEEYETAARYLNPAADQEAQSQDETFSLMPESSPPQVLPELNRSDAGTSISRPDGDAKISSSKTHRFHSAPAQARSEAFEDALPGSSRRDGELQNADPVELSDQAVYILSAHRPSALSPLPHGSNYREIQRDLNQADQKETSAVNESQKSKSFLHSEKMVERMLQPMPLQKILILKKFVPLSISEGKLNEEESESGGMRSISAGGAAILAPRSQRISMPFSKIEMRAAEKIQTQMQKVINVNIGTVEVKGEPKPPVARSSARSGSYGFDEYAAIRSYAGWVR